MWVFNVSFNYLNHSFIALSSNQCVFFAETETTRNASNHGTPKLETTKLSVAFVVLDSFSFLFSYYCTKQGSLWPSYAQSLQDVFLWELQMLFFRFLWLYLYKRKRSCRPRSSSSSAQKHSRLYVSFKKKNCAIATLRYTIEGFCGDHSLDCSPSIIFKHNNTFLDFVCQCACFRSGHMRWL